MIGIKECDRKTYETPGFFGILRHFRLLSGNKSKANILYALAIERRRTVATMSVRLFVHDSLTTTSNEEVFHEEFLENLEAMLPHCLVRVSEELYLIPRTRHYFRFS